LFRTLFGSPVLNDFFGGGVKKFAVGKFSVSRSRRFCNKWGGFELCINWFNICV